MGSNPPQFYQKIYAVFQCNLFEGPWMGCQELGDAISSWAQSEWPEWFDAADGKPDLLEGTIRDEEGEEALETFIHQLPPKTKALALSLVVDHIASHSLPSQKSNHLESDLKRALRSLPKTSQTEPHSPNVSKPDHLAALFFASLNNDPSQCLSFFHHEAQVTIQSRGKDVTFPYQSLPTFLQSQQGLSHQFLAAEPRDDGEVWKYSIQIVGPGIQKKVSQNVYVQMEEGKIRKMRFLQP